MSRPFALVDAFVTERPWSGNPAGVCLLEAWPSDAWMQGVAAEMNQAETAFLVAEAGAFGLRWFTPSVEVDLCGHATLASAHWLWESGVLPATSPATFRSKSGVLTARQESGLVVLDFPAEAPQPGDAPGVGEALGVRPVWTGANRMDWFVVVGSQAEVEAAAPHMDAVRATGLRGVVLTARAAPGGPDYVSRFFAPQSGIDEDPVTGSAHCALGPYWSRVLGQDSLVGEQLSSRRGRVGTAVRGDRVLLRGAARTVTSGNMLVQPE